MTTRSLDTTVHATPSRRLRTVRGAASIFATLLLCGGVAPSASALDGVVDASRSELIFRTAVSPSVRAAAPTRDEASAEKPTLNQRLRRVLGRIPLRPVRIGTTPRLPDDPEPGMGLVVRVPF